MTRLIKTRAHKRAHRGVLITRVRFVSSFVAPRPGESVDLLPASAVVLCLLTDLNALVKYLSNLEGYQQPPGADVDTDRVHAYVYAVTAAGAFFSKMLAERGVWLLANAYLQRDVCECG